MVRNRNAPPSASPSTDDRSDAPIPLTQRRRTCNTFIGAIRLSHPQRSNAPVALRWAQGACSIQIGARHLYIDIGATRL
ncbi:hypothetical protein PoB_000338700 [Plakobranchus ocellatus]|uniref:Uncharacterized protein n=1 Tax=Plakobranchus ocellatus TaxID=259542 RepID=A0AAV3Y468_9GAST|nr:hypothetical protein PoB_000338700 [Plakobranchus ocellatus]